MHPKAATLYLPTSSHRAIPATVPWPSCILGPVRVSSLFFCSFSLRPRGSLLLFRAFLELEACAHFHARLLRAERGHHRPDPRGHAPERDGTGAGEGGLVFGAFGGASTVDAGPAARGELN